MNVVGNNDLCDTNINILGTGDDKGKSNGYFFSLFYCYEIDPNIAPIFTGVDGITRYIPSVYYFGNNRCHVRSAGLASIVPHTFRHRRKYRRHNRHAYL